MVNKITTYFSEVTQEMSKVSWPSREEMVGSAVIVVVLCLLVSIFIYSIDLLLNRGIELIF